MWHCCQFSLTLDWSKASCCGAIMFSSCLFAKTIIRWKKATFSSSACSDFFYSLPVALLVIVIAGDKSSGCYFSKETKNMHVVQEQLSIYVGYSLDRHFRLILKAKCKLKCKMMKIVDFLFSLHSTQCAWTRFNLQNRFSDVCLCSKLQSHWQTRNNWWNAHHGCWTYTWPLCTRQTRMLAVMILS